MSILDYLNTMRSQCHSVGVSSGESWKRCRWTSAEGLACTLDRIVWRNVTQTFSRSAIRLRSNKVGRIDLRSR